MSDYDTIFGGAASKINVSNPNDSEEEKKKRQQQASQVASKGQKSASDYDRVFGGVAQNVEANFKNPPPQAPQPEPTNQTQPQQQPAPQDPSLVDKAVKGAGDIASLIGSAVSNVLKNYLPQQTNTPTNQQQVQPGQPAPQAGANPSQMVQNPNPNQATQSPLNTQAMPPTTNLLDAVLKDPIGTLVQKPASYILNNTGVFGETIKKTAAEIYKDPLLLNPYYKQMKKYEAEITAKNPEAAQKVANFNDPANNPLAKVLDLERKTGQGVAQGAARVYGNFVPSVQKWLDTELEKPVQQSDIVANSVGQVVGTLGAFTLGGEFATALKFGKAAIPLTFAALGQTALPADTPLAARGRNAIIDATAGAFLEYFKPIQNLSKLESVKSLSKSLGVLSAQIYADARSVGATHEQAIEQVKNNGILMVGLHGVFVAAKAGEALTKSKFKEGDVTLTPDQVREQVNTTNLAGTPLGDHLMQQADQAQQMGKDISISGIAAKKSKVADVLNLKTPNGIQVNTEFVDPVRMELISDSSNPNPTGQAKQGEIINAEIVPTEKPITKPVPKDTSPLAEKARENVRLKPEGDYIDNVDKATTENLHSNPVALRDEYIKKFGNEVNTDLAREVFPEYKGINAAEVQNASSGLKNIVYDHLLETKQGEGNNSVLTLAGGPGSGKSSALKQFDKSEYPVVLDTTLSEKTSEKIIQKQLDKGFDAQVAYVIRDPLDAWRSVIKRSLEEGRPVSEGYFLKAHEGAREQILKLSELYKDNPKVSIAFFDNTKLGKDASITGVEKVKEMVYNRDTLQKEISKITDEAYKNGQINKQLYEKLSEDRVATEVPSGSKQVNRENSARENSVTPKSDVNNPTPLPHNNEKSDSSVPKKDQPIVGESRGVVDQTTSKSDNEIKKNQQIIQEKEASLKNTYKTVPLARVEEELFNVWQELDIAEAGARYRVESDNAEPDSWLSKQSSFPKWISEDLRRKDLVDKAKAIIQNGVEGFKYPENSPRARAILDEILGELDNRIGVDTSTIRADIMNEYAGQTATSSRAKTETSSPIQRTTEGSSESGRGTATSIPIGLEPLGKSLAELQPNKLDKYYTEAVFNRIKNFFKVSTTEQAIQKFKDAGYNTNNPAFVKQFIDDYTSQTTSNFKGNSNTSYADMGGYADLNNYPEGSNQQKEQWRDEVRYFTGNLNPIEMPELVKLAREITGNTPVLKNLMTYLDGSYVAGKFSTRSNEIKLNPKIFEDPKIAAKVLAHELGHATDFMPEETMKRGNILGRIASLKKYMGSFLAEYPGAPEEVITPTDRQRLRKQAAELRQNTEGGGTTADDVLSVWRDLEDKDPDLSTYISKLDDKQKVEIAKEAMKGNLPEWFDYNKSPITTKRFYEDLLREEITKRRLFEKNQIMGELKRLSKIWKPFDENASAAYTKYRNSSPELYADALSVLFTRPDLVEAEAPQFFKAYFNYLDNKPTVKSAFFNLQDMLNKGEEAIFNDRQQAINDEFKKGEDIWHAKELEKNQTSTNLGYALQVLLNDKNYAATKKVGEALKSGKVIPDDKNPIYSLHGLNYVDGKLKNFVADNFQPAYEKASKIESGWSHVGEILMLERAINERGEMANPGGYDPKTAQDQLNGLEKMIGQKDWQALKEVVADFRKGVEATNKMAEENQFYTPELLAQMNANKFYATFQVLDYLDTNISPQVYKQVGTLKDVANPATSTIIKSISIMKAIERNNAKKDMIGFLKDNYGDEIEEAKTVFAGKGRRNYLPAKDPKQDLVIVIEDGKGKGYYVEKTIADSFNYHDDTTIKMAAKVARMISMSGIYRSLFTSLNLGFQSFNATRDFFRLWKSIPDRNLADALVSLPLTGGRYVKAIPSAFSRAIGKPNATIKAMENSKMLGQTYNDMFIAGSSDDQQQIERVLQKTGILKGKRSGIKKALTPIFKLLEGIEFAGNFIETLPKVAGYEAMRNRLPAGELAEFVRTKAGSPDFRIGGTATPVTNSIFIFSNAIKEGIKSDIDTATNPKYRSGFWWKTIISDILPKLLMAGAAAGVFGAWYKDRMDDVSEYDKTNYNIVPIGVDANNKSIILRVPKDETGRLIGGLFWKLMNFTDKKELNLNEFFKDFTDLASFGAGQVPGYSPAFDSYSAIASYLSGQNPYDSFRQRNVIPDQEFAAGPKYSAPILIDWIIKNQGLSVILPSYKPANQETTPLQDLLSAPVLSNIVGRWLKVTDQGQSESLREITTASKTGAAAQNVEEKAALDDAISNYQKSGDNSITGKMKAERELVNKVFGKPNSQDELTQAKNLMKKFRVGLTKGKADPNMNALISAQNNNEKALLLNEIHNRLEKDQFNSLIKEAYIQKIISADVIAKYKYQSQQK